PRLRNTEVRDLHLTFAADEDILRFDVRMDDTGAVGKADSRADLNREIQRPFDTKRPLRTDDLLQILPVYKLHDDVMGDLASRVGIGADIVQRDNIRMGQISDR